MAKRAESEQLRANLDFLPSVGETENERLFSRLSSVKVSRVLKSFLLLAR